MLSSLKRLISASEVNTNSEKIISHSDSITPAATAPAPMRKE